MKELPLINFVKKKKNLDIPDTIENKGVNVCLAWRCDDFFSNIQYLLSTNHTFKNYKNMFLLKKNK